MKIKITKDMKEYEGIVEEKVVTPFGNSAHINVGKKHTGKIMPVINPTNPEYKWILPITKLKKVEVECDKILSRDSGKFVHYKRNAVDNLSTKFTIDDLAKVLNILKKGKNSALIKEIKSAYDLS